MPICTYYDPTGAEDDFLPPVIREAVQELREALNFDPKQLIVERLLLEHAGWKPWRPRKKETRYQVLIQHGEGIEYQIINHSARFDEDKGQDKGSINTWITGNDLLHWIDGVHLGYHRGWRERGK